MVDNSHLIILEEIGSRSKDGVFIFHLAEQKFLYFNEALCKLIDVPSAQLTNQPHTAIEKVHPEDREYLQFKFEELIEKQRLHNVEFSITTPDAALRPVSLDAYLLMEDGVATGFLKDISKLKEHENYISNYGAKKDSMLEILSHNLSGPLTLTSRVLGLTDKAIRQQKFHDVKAQLQFIRTSTENCIDIIHDFLKDEHLVSERIFVKQNRYDVVEKVAYVVDQFKRSYQRDNLFLISEAKQLFVTGDDVKFFQVVNNLISNALKFTPANCTIEVQIKEMAESFMFAVKDDGIGIPQHLQPLIFQRYTPAGRAGLQGEKSMGLGLSIVRTLVKLMGGEITFQSKENVGTTFFVSLPKA
jgi:two-component system, OmpR family, sensor histidine kinase VicK